MTATGSAPSRTLHGLRVLDLTRNLAGPYCTMALADLGADVIKVESPGAGDDTRQWAPPRWAGVSTTFLAANRNKRSLAADLDSDGGNAAVRRLAETCDVVVESFRPGSLARRGLDYEAVRQANPSVVYCSISAYGGVGPRAGSPGYDPILQAETGIMDLTGHPDQPPARLGIGAIDLGTGLWAVIAIQAALAQRERTGEGCLIEASLFETSVWWLSYHLAGYLATDVVPQRQGTGTPFIVPYQAFETADGFVMITAGNDRAFRALCAALGVDGLAADPRFATNGDRVARRSELIPVLQEAIRPRTSAEWEAVLAAHGVPASRVKTIADLAVDEQLSSLGLLTSQPRSDDDGPGLVDLPVRLNGRRADQRFAPPRLGEHTDEILTELGIPAERIARLRAEGAVA